MFFLDQTQNYTTHRTSLWDLACVYFFSYFSAFYLCLILGSSDAACSLLIEQTKQFPVSEHLFGQFPISGILSSSSSWGGSSLRLNWECHLPTGIVPVGSDEISLSQLLCSLFFFGGGWLVLTVICYYLCTHSLFLSPPGQNPYLICSLLCPPKQFNQSVELMICCDRPLHWWPHNIYWVPIMCQASCKVSCFLV